MSGLWVHLLLGVGAAVGMLWLGSVFDVVKPCPEPMSALNRPECAWSLSYDEARAKFLAAAAQAKASRVDSLLISKENELFIDIAVFEGRKDQLVMHISGTRGVEAYVGSAIQIAALKHLSINASGPTVVLVHVLNPFGMKFSRRVNENNVDLNRNVLFGADQEARRKRDPNIAGYEDLYNVLNPSGPPCWSSFITWMARLAKVLLEPGGASKFRRALITGTYSREKGIYFGGLQLQQSIVALRSWLEGSSLLESVRRLIIIDVHSGLGDFASDTILVDPKFNSDALIMNPHSSKVPFVKPIRIERLSGEEVPTQEADASVGYDLAGGFVDQGLPRLFKHGDIRYQNLAQEFGTFAAVRVAYALIHENQAWQYGSVEDRKRNTANLKQVFAPDSQAFVEGIVSRGLSLLFNSLEIVGKF